MEQIGVEANLRKLLPQILERACDLLGAEGGLIGLADSNRDAIRIEAVVRLPTLELGADGTELIRGGTMAMAPILWREKTLGYIALGIPPGQTDHARLEQIAGHIAIAVENARLLAENERSLIQASQMLHTTERIGNAMSVAEVVTAYLEQVAAGGRYTCTVVLYEFDEIGAKIGNLVRGRWTPGESVELMEYRVPTKQDALDPILTEGKTIRIANALTDRSLPKSLRDEQLRDNRPAVALVPLMSDRRRIGLVILSDPEPHEWTDEELMPFQATAAQLAAALASRRDHDALVESSRKLAVMEERRKIARDLHDSVTQVLFSLNLLSQTLEPGQVPPDEIVERLNQLSRRGLQEMRSLLEELRPVQSQPKVLTLGQRISSYAATVVGLPDFMLDDQTYKGAPTKVEDQLLGIASEALNNVAKHAKAEHVRALLQSSGPEVKLRIEDNGIGLKRESRSRRGGLGLTSMSERASEIGAQICVESNPGKGTTIEVLWERGK